MGTGGSQSGKTNSASTTVQTGSGLSTSSPWSQLQPFLMDVYNQAGSMYHSGIGQGFYPGSTVVPFSPETSGAHSFLTNYANRGVPGLAQGTAALQNAITNPDDVNYRKQLGGSASSTPVTAGQPQLQSIADFSELSPYIGAQFNQGSDLIRNQVGSLAQQRGMYGTATHQDLLEKNLGNLFTNIAAPAYEAERGRQLSAIGMLRQGQEGDFNRRMAGLTQAAQLTGAEGANRAALTQQLGNLFDLGQEPARILADVGSAREEQAGNYLQDTIDRYNAERDAPWQSLSNYIGAITGVPYGTTSAASGSGIARTVGEANSEVSMGK